MGHPILLAVPLIVASLMGLLAFVGCMNDYDQFTASPDRYVTDVTTNAHLVSYWRLGEAAGATTAADSIVSVPYDGSLNPQKFTVEALVTLDGNDGDFRAVVSSRDIVAASQATHGYILYASAQDNWEGWLGDGSASWQTLTGPPATLGGHFLALTYDGTTLRLYVDPADEVDKSVALDAPYAPNDARELRLGAGANAATPAYFFNGTIDDVAIYDDALDYGTIRAHFVLAWTGMNLQ